MKAVEHRAIGDEAAGRATVRLAAEPEGPGLELGYGDVVALSGDFFVPRPSAGPTPGDPPYAALVADSLVGLAAVAGDRGTVPGSRDEIVCALKVMALDGEVTDPRFAPGGRFAEYEFTPSAATTEVEQRVRDRFLALGCSNDDHFVAPGPRGPETAADRPAPRADNAVAAYRAHHQVALEHACSLGRRGGDLVEAMALEAAAQHFLTDAFAAGHLRTPVAAMREFWQVRYPAFWQSLQRKVASETATKLRELAAPLRLVPAETLHAMTMDAVRTRTAGYPRITLGDLLAKVFHDWDNVHGLVLEDGGVIYGDGCLEQGRTRELAVAAARAGIDDVEVAFRLGVTGRSYRGGALARVVREATGAPGGAFLAETKVPRPSRDNPVQNWRAADLATLWSAPIVGTGGPTVGDAVTEALQAGAELPRRLACLGTNVVGSMPVPPVPGVRAWLERKACRAYHQGFIAKLTTRPAEVVAEVVADAGGDGGGGGGVAGGGARSGVARRARGGGAAAGGAAGKAAAGGGAGKAAAGKLRPELSGLPS